MMLERKRTRASILPLCLASACLFSTLTGLGCGGDSGDPEEESSPATGSDAGGAPKDAGAGPVAKDSGGPPSSMGTVGRPPGSAKDSGTEEPDDTKPATPSGNTIYTGGPDCPTYGRKVAGTVEGKTVMYDGPTMSRVVDTFFEATGTATAGGKIRIDWLPALDTDGKASKVTKGFIELPTSFGVGPYCLIEGEVQHDPTFEESERTFFKITKVKKRVDDKCEGEDLPAELKICDVG